ncbi:MAG: hypothetical protein AABX51_07215 [Nanoarchaeota archaeon]
MKNWYRKLGFEHDPFTTNPEADDELVEYQDAINEVAYRIDSGSMAFVEGQAGMGKTALLVQIINRFEGKGRVIYYDCSELKKKVEIDMLMKNRFGFFGRLFNVVPTDMIILLDNVDSLSRANSERIKYYFDQNNIRSVIFAGESFKKSDLPQSIKDRIGIHVITLQPLSDYGAVELVSKRLGEHNAMISDEATKLVFTKASRNTKKFLELCSKLFSSLTSHEHSITLDDARKVLRNV